MRRRKNTYRWIQGSRGDRSIKSIKLGSGSVSRKDTDGERDDMRAFLVSGREKKRKKTNGSRVGSAALKWAGLMSAVAGT